MLYDVKTGQKANVPPEQWASKIQTGKYNLDPNSTVMVDDGSGNIVPMKGSEAAPKLADPSFQGYVVPDKAIEAKNRQTQYGGVAQQALGAGEQALDVATLGVSKPLISGTVGLIAGKEAQNKYELDRIMREEENPLGANLGKVAGVVADPFGAFAGASKLAGGVVKPFFSEGGGFLSKIAQKTLTGGVEGTILNSANYTLPKLIDDNPYSSDALLDHMATGFRDFSLLHGIAGVGEESLGAINKMKDMGKKYLDKSLAMDEEIAPSIKTVPVEVDNLKRNDSPFGRKSTDLEMKTDAQGNISLAHKDGIKTTAVNAENIGGKGADFTNPAGLEKIGQEIGVSDLSVKYATKLENETDRQFLERAKTEQTKYDWVKSHQDFLTEPEIATLEKHDIALSILKEDPANIEAKSLLKQANDGIDTISENIAGKSKESGKIYDGKISRIEPAMGDYINNLDHVKSGETLHVFNPKSITGDLTQVIDKGEFAAEAKAVSEELGVKSSFLNKQNREIYNKVTKYMKDELYPKSPADLEQGEHVLDYISKRNSENLVNSKINLDNTVEKAINQLEQSGIGTTMTHQDIANYIENNIMDRYRDPHTGAPKPGLSKEFNALQKYADEFKSSGYSLGKYSEKIYHPIDMRELRDIRIRTDKLAKWENPEAGIVPEAARDLRDHIEKHIIKTLGKNNESLVNEYLTTKQASHFALQADAIIGAATVKAIQKAAKGSDAFSAMVGSKIGGMIGGKPGSLLGFYLGGKVGGGNVLGMLNQYNTGIRNLISQNLAESLTKYDSQLIRAANAVMSKTESSYTQKSHIQNKTYKDIKKDEENLIKSQNGQTSYFNDFIGRNKGLYGVAPESTNKMIQTSILANKFLLSKIPQNPYKGIPWREDLWEPNQVDVDKYFRYKEAVTKPGNILSQLQKGYITPEATEVLNIVFPQTKQELQNKIVTNLKKDIPQEKRILMFKVFGIPMDNYSSGRLFAEMQGNAAGLIQQEQAQAQQGFNPQNRPLNTSKMSDSMANLTTGNRSLSTQD